MYLVQKELERQPLCFFVCVLKIISIGDGAQ